MTPKRTLSEAERERVLQELRRDAAERRQGYREKALALFPHVCGSCGREFSGRRLRELTVHHRDHNHEYNPSDGSNWELLCLYCHDHEHEKHRMKGHGGGTDDVFRPSGGLGEPFAGLDRLLSGDEGDRSGPPG